MPDDPHGEPPDEAPEDPWTVEEPEAEESSGGHDDIMKRLLDYQRSLREGASPIEAAEVARQGLPERRPVERSTVTSSLLDLTPDEPEAEPEPQALVDADTEPEIEAEIPDDARAEEEPTPAVATPSPAEKTLQAGELSRAELQERLARLEGTLEHLEARLGEIRHSFQEMAISADEGFAAVEEEIGEARPERMHEEPRPTDERSGLTE